MASPYSSTSDSRVFVVGEGSYSYYLCTKENWEDTPNPIDVLCWYDGDEHLALVAAIERALKEAYTQHKDVMVINGHTGAEIACLFG